MKRLKLVSGAVILGCCVTACGGRETQPPPARAGVATAGLVDDTNGARIADIRQALLGVGDFTLSVNEVAADRALTIDATLDTPAGPAAVRATATGERDLALAVGVLAVAGVLTGYSSPGDEGPQESIELVYGAMRIPYTQSDGGKRGAGLLPKNTVAAITSMSTQVVALAGGPNAAAIASQLAGQLNLPSACAGTSGGGDDLPPPIP